MLNGTATGDKGDHALWRLTNQLRRTGSTQVPSVGALNRWGERPGIWSRGFRATADWESGSRVVLCHCQRTPRFRRDASGLHSYRNIPLSGIGFPKILALDLRRLRVGYRGNLASAVTNRFAGIVGSSQLVRLILPDYPAQGMAWIFVGVEPAAVFDELTRFGADEFLTSQGTFDWPNTFRTARTVPAVEYLQADRLRKKLIEEMAAIMETVDVLVTLNRDEALLFISNLTGQPCVVIPHGGSTSLSFIGKLYDEATILVLAKAYQDSTTFHTGRPPQFTQ
jgi:hypothetical protein